MFKPKPVNFEWHFGKRDQVLAGKGYWHTPAWPMGIAFQVKGQVPGGIEQ